MHICRQTTKFLPVIDGGPAFTSLSCNSRKPGAQIGGLCHTSNAVHSRRSAGCKREKSAQNKQLERQRWVQSLAQAELQHFLYYDPL